jgi:hypothetical protein
MKLGDGKGVKAGQWFANEMLREIDINFVGETAYLNATDLLAILAEQGIATGSTKDTVVAGLRLEWNASLTSDLRAGAAISFSGYYLDSDGNWAFNASAGDVFSAILPEDTAVVVDSGGALDRTDTIEIRPVLDQYNSISRQFKDPSTGILTSSTVNTRRSFAIEVQILKGTEGAGVAPAHTAGWIKVAEVLVESGVGAIDQTKIKDVRDSDTWTTEASHTLYRLIHNFGIDFGAGSDQVSAVDLPIADAGGQITGTEVETALQEITGAGRTTETIKENNDLVNNRVGLNDIINGGLEIWQRGTSFAAVANGEYTADRWRYIKAGTVAVHTISRDTDVPTNSLSQYSIKIDCTTADASLGAGDTINFAQFIEGYNFRKYVGRNMVVSFWVKATKTGTYCLSVRNSGIDRSYIREYTISSSNTWEFKTVTIPMDYSGGTWDYTNGTGLMVRWVLMCGSTYQGTKDQWNSSNTIGTASQVNACDNVANNFWLTAIKAELGTVATDFIPADFAIEIERCQRYYEKSYDLATNPGTATNAGRMNYRAHTATNYARFMYYYRTRKRDTPTVTPYSSGTGTSGKIRNASTATDLNGASVNPGEMESALQVSNVAVAAGNVLSAHVVVDAELT